MCIPILVGIGVGAHKHKKHQHNKHEKQDFEKAMMQKFMNDGDIKNFDDWKNAKKDCKELEKRKSLKLQHNDPEIT